MKFLLYGRFFVHFKKMVSLVKIKKNVICLKSFHSFVSRHSTNVLFWDLSSLFGLDPNKKNYLKFPFGSNGSYEWLFSKHGGFACSQTFLCIPTSFQLKLISILLQISQNFLIFCITFTAITALELTMNPFVYGKFEHINALFLA
jgi:hypothetical protein